MATEKWIILNMDIILNFVWGQLIFSEIYLGNFSWKVSAVTEPY